MFLRLFLACPSRKSRRQMFALALLVLPGQTLKMQNAIAGVVAFSCTPLAKWVSERGNIMLLSPGDGLKRPRLLSAVWHLQLPGPCVLHTTRARCDLRTDPSWRAAPWPVTADGGQNVETEGGGSCPSRPAPHPLPVGTGRHRWLPPHLSTTPGVTAHLLIV